MTVYADTPRWSRHGTLWGHLISDSSLGELHALADRAGLFPRSFDLDHYDWPESAAPALAEAGAVFVGNRELTRRLLASGLRVPGAARAATRRARTIAAARELGLTHVPLDLVPGLLGHADPLPPHEAGAFRITRDAPPEAPRIEAGDEDARRAAAHLLRTLDELSRATTGSAWVGQVLDRAD